MVLRKTLPSSTAHHHADCRVFSTTSLFSPRNAAAATSSKSKTTVLNASSSSSSYKPELPNYCSNCGQPTMALKVPQGDNHVRAVCESCDHVVYSNPKVVVSCVVVTDDDRCLLGKRSIEPRKGYWGIPQGYMEHGETSRQAAVREVYEETGVSLDAADPSGDDGGCKLLRLRGLYNVPGSVQILYEARGVPARTVETQIASFASTEVNHESSEVALFHVDSIPYDEICFPTVQWAIQHCLVGDISSPAASVAMPGSRASWIQQKTKFYDPETDQWNEYEDEPKC